MIFINIIFLNIIYIIFKNFNCRNFAIWEVLREDDFSPLKNGDDAAKETPTTCRNDLYNQHVKWLVKAGATFQPDLDPVGENAKVANECEISPLVSYNGEVRAISTKTYMFKKVININV